MSNCSVDCTGLEPSLGGRGEIRVSAEFVNGVDVDSENSLPGAHHLEVSGHEVILESENAIVKQLLWTESRDAENRRVDAKAEVGTEAYAHTVELGSAKIGPLESEGSFLDSFFGGDGLNEFSDGLLDEWVHIFCRAGTKDAIISDVIRLDETCANEAALVFRRTAPPFFESARLLRAAVIVEKLVTGPDMPRLDGAGCEVIDFQCLYKEKPWVGGRSGDW